jgi:hypothetical protein
VRYLVEVDGESFPIEKTQPLQEGENFTHEGKVYIVRLIQPGRDEFHVVKAEFAGEVGPGQAG